MKREFIDIPVTCEYKDYVIDSVRSLHQEGDLNIQPEWQRYDVWDIEKRSRFIESLLLKFPVPPIYLTETGDGSMAVIDGQQRLTAILLFLGHVILDRNDKPIKEPSFRLKGLTFFKELDKKNFKELGPEIIKKFLYNCSLPAVIIRKESPPRAKYEIFERLNRGVTPLIEQEIRNCVYHGPYNNLLIKMAQMPIAKQYLRERTPYRMDREELILRFFSFQNTSYNNYSGDMKKFLNDDMEENQNKNKNFLDNLENKCKKAFDLTRTVFGDNGFKKYILPLESEIDVTGETVELSDIIEDFEGINGKYSTQINKAVFDIIMYSFAVYEKPQIVKAADAIRELFLDLSTTEEKFKKSLGVYDTASTNNVKTRFSVWLAKLNDLIGPPEKEPRNLSLSFKRSLFENNPECEECHNEIKTIDDAHLDHIFEYAKGGRTVPDNLRLTHRFCNWYRINKNRAGT